MVFISQKGISFVLLVISLRRVSGGAYEEDEFIRVNGNNFERVEWPELGSLTGTTLEALCKNLRPPKYRDAREFVGKKDGGYLVFENQDYESREIDAASCRVTHNGRVEFFFFTRGTGPDSYFLLVEDAEKIFKLSALKNITQPDYAPAEEAMQLPAPTDAERRKRVQETARKLAKTRPKSFKKQNYVNATPVYHRTIWGADE